MRSNTPTYLFLGLLLASPLSLACGDDTGGGQGGSGEGGSATTTSQSSGSTTTGTGGQGGGGGGGEGGEGGGTIGPFESCTEGGFTECFSNYDCESAGTRCQNVNTELEPVACCEPGARGTGALGASCSSENDCASAICIEKTGQPSQCSDTCDGNGDCTAASGLPNCAPILFSGSDDDWCQPTPDDG